MTWYWSAVGGETWLLIVEPYGRDYWLNPGQTALVTTIGTAGDVAWPGTTRPGEPFEIDYRHGSISVHTNGVEAHVVDRDGRQIECGHQRPGYLAGLEVVGARGGS